MMPFTRPFPFAKAIVAAEAAMFLAVFGQDLYRVAAHTLKNENMDYVILVPPIVAYLLYEKWPKTGITVAAPDWIGAGMLVAGLAVFFTGRSVESHFFMGAAAWMAAATILWFHMGKDCVRALWFPVLFALAAVPPPETFFRSLVEVLAGVSTFIGVTVGRWMGMSIFQVGALIDAGGNSFSVIDACSGIRYFIPMGLLCILIAHYTKASLVKRISIVAFGLMAVITANGLRLTLTFDMAGRYGMETALGFFHGVSGWLIFMVALALVLGWVKLIRNDRHGMPREPGDARRRSVLQAHVETQPENGTVKFSIQHAACLIILAIAALLQHSVFA
jgi:exosortase